MKRLTMTVAIASALAMTGCGSFQPKSPTPKQESVAALEQAIQMNKLLNELSPHSHVKADGQWGGVNIKDLAEAHKAMKAKEAVTSRATSTTTEQGPSVGSATKAATTHVVSTQKTTELKAQQKAKAPVKPKTIAELQKARFNIKVDNLPAQKFFKGLVRNTGYNMMVHHSIEGNVSVELSNVTVPEVMEAMRKMYGYEYTFEKNLYQVVPATLQTEMFRVNYLDIVRNGQSETQVSAGSLSAGNDNNGTVGTQISTETESDFWGKLEETLAVMVQGEGRHVVVTPQTGVVVVRGFPSELATVRNYLAEAEDVLHRQVYIEAKILEVSLDDGFQSGINWSILGSPGNGKNVMFQQTGATLSQNDLIGGIFRADLSLKDFTAIIDLLDSQGEVQVLSSPRVSTVNNQKAVIRVGSDEFFVTDIETTQTTGDNVTVNPSIELTPFFSGIALDVTPQVSEDGSIVLHVHPTVSEVLDQQKQIVVGDADFNIPLALSSIRESDSIVRAKSGQVIVIGGLMTSSLKDTEAGAAGLKDAPIFGGLFTQNRTAQKKTELVILLRPVLADSELMDNELQRTLTSFKNFD
ncbi:pilus (MSHA type) biogenesis protein MshL [Neptuniibacter sp. QD37_11]|uniref:pilus (MSHA type) biogenesis protein MshL n=1 Tax=Neptuniibacter sp. QD37_11 TaxID=3398209 RepID=UPI0039F52B05